MKTTLPFLSATLSIALCVLSVSQANDQADSYNQKFKKPQPTGCDHHYRNGVTKFAKMNETAQPGGIVLLGDSITAVFPVKRAPKEWNLHARGIGGDGVGTKNHKGLIHRLNVSCHDLKPSKVFIKIGINDTVNWMKNDTPYPTEKQRIQKYKQIVANIKKNNKDATIYLSSILPTRAGKPKFKFESYNESIIKMNTELKAIAESEERVNYIDLHSKFYDPNTKQMYARFTRDGVHINQLGYDVWIEVLKEIIEK